QGQNFVSACPASRRGRRKPAVQKRGKDRRNFWISASTWLLLLLLLGAAFFWFFNREPTAVTLKYGELTQILQARDPALRLLNVRVAGSEIRGELHTNDVVSDGSAQPARLTQARTFRVARKGLENDPGLLKLLKERVGKEFQGEEEESALRGVYSLLMSFVLIFAVVLAG